MMQYQISSTEWTAITSPGQSGECWLDEDNDYTAKDVRVIQGITVPVQADVTKGKKVFKPTSNRDVLPFIAETPSHVLYAICMTQGATATISVDMGIGSLVVKQHQNAVDNASVDAFGRARVSLPISQFGYSNQYGNNPLIFEQWVVGTGTSTHDPNTSTVIMSTGGTVSGAKCTRQSRQYFRYVPGKSLMVLMSGNFGAPAVNVRKRRGYFDDQNGCFFEQTGTDRAVVLRSFATGAAVDTRFVQGSWNIDNMDGTGPSGVVFSNGKTQIFVIDLEWLGVGRVRFGLNIDGKTYYIHQIMNANVNTVAYMTSANLPIRAEIENTGTAAGSTTMQLICSTVIIEGDGDSGGFYDHAVGRGITVAAVTTRRAVLSIRPKATFNGIVNRGTINIEEFDLSVATNDAYFEIIYGGVLGGSPNWVSAGDNSIAEYDIAGTTVTGGEVMHAGYIASSSGSFRNTINQSLNTRFPLVLDHAGANPINISIVMTAVAGTSNALASMCFREYY